MSQVSFDILNLQTQLPESLVIPASLEKIQILTQVPAFPMQVSDPQNHSDCASGWKETSGQRDTAPQLSAN